MESIFWVGAGFGVGFTIAVGFLGMGFKCAYRHYMELRG